MATLVFGVFGHATDAALAIEDLKELGIKAKNISVVTKQRLTVEQITHTAGIGKADVGIGNTGIFGTARGIGTGLGLIPEMAVAAGPAAHKLAGAVLNEEEIEGEGLAVGLMGLGIPQEDAAIYAKHAALENIVVIVLLGEESSSKVNEVFSKHDAIPIESIDSRQRN